MVWLEAGPEPTIKGGARGAPRSGAGRRAPGGGAASDSRARASSGGFRTDSPRPARRRRRPSLAAGRGRRAVPGALGARAAPPPRRRDERGERPPGPVAPGPAARGDAGVAGPRGRGEGAGQRPEGEASSGRCGWRLAGAAAPGEESPPRDAVGVRRGPGLPGSAHCIQRGVRPASPGGAPSPPPPAGTSSADGRGGAALWWRLGPRGDVPAEQTPLRGARGARVLRRVPRCRFQPVPSCLHRRRHGRGSRPTWHDSSRVWLRPRTRASARSSLPAELGLGSSAAGLRPATRPRDLGSRVPAPARLWARFQPGTRTVATAERAQYLARAGTPSVGCCFLHFFFYFRVLL